LKHYKSIQMVMMVDPFQQSWHWNLSYFYWFKDM